MSNLAAIIDEFGPAYLAARNGRLPPSHGRALRDIVSCRTAHLGGHLYRCEACDSRHYQYHSCQNRHCPRCQYQAGQEWLARQQQLLLPVPYFLVTFTLPAPLRETALRRPQAVYDLLFRTAAAALQELAGDPRHSGGRLGLLGVLHTWGRQLNYHPHVHFLVPAVALAADGRRAIQLDPHYLLPVRALSRLFRGKFCAGWRRQPDLPALPREVWETEWVVHCQPVGDGQAALNYLAPYIFRVAISDRRIVKVSQGKVTFRYRPSDGGTPRACTLDGQTFLLRFLHHVLPTGFVKVRYYGFFAAACRPQLTLIRLWLNEPVALFEEEAEDTETEKASRSWQPTCPTCGQALIHMRKVPRRWEWTYWRPP